MKLAGLINICCGFVLVLTPSNWADILRDVIRYRAKAKVGVPSSPVFQKVEPESLPASHRDHSQGRPADRIHRLPTAESVWESEMNERRVRQDQLLLSQP